MWTIAAPALAASIADCAICCGVTGTAGLRPGVSAEPVTAHEIITLRCMGTPAGPGEWASIAEIARTCPRSRNAACMDPPSAAAALRPVLRWAKAKHLFLL